MYPENACREALVNAIAHRDYSNEGAGIEIYVFDDRIEVKNPGSLLSSVRIEDIRAMRGAHESRNSFVARTLRELGYMRELGEGMRRIFELMISNELAPPEIKTQENTFILEMHHKTIYSTEEQLWLSNFEIYKLLNEEKSIVILGRGGALISTQDIIDRVGIIDIEHYRKLVYSLQKHGILLSEVSKSNAKRIADKKRIGIRSVPRFKIVIPDPLAALLSSKVANATESNSEHQSESFELYVGKISTSTKKSDVFNEFGKFGEIENLFLHSRKGYAFVGFSTREARDRALNAVEPIKINGRACMVSRSRREITITSEGAISVAE